MFWHVLAVMWVVLKNNVLNCNCVYFTHLFVAFQFSNCEHNASLLIFLTKNIEKSMFQWASCQTNFQAGFLEKLFIQNSINYEFFFS